MNVAVRRLLLTSAAFVPGALVALASIGADAGADADLGMCAEGFRIPERPMSETAESGGDPETILLSADAADRVGEEVSRLSGNATVELGTRLLRSDEIVYDQSEGVVDARGDVRYWEEGLFVSGESARADLENEVVTVESGMAFMLGDGYGYGEAGRIVVLGENRATATDVAYTTCAPGEDDWRITAGRIELDRVEDTGTARDIWFEIDGQRMFYLPWVSFPLSSRRKSGFLTSSFGTDSSTGVDLAVPYYFNLAPDNDATLTTRVMSERGVQAQGEFRFLSRDFGSGRFAAEYLPFDAKFDDQRAVFDLAHRHSWSDRWSTDARMEWVSDSQYLQDLGTGLAQSSRAYLPRRFDAAYRGDGWDALMRFSGFQTLDKSLLAHERPYARLPQILLRTHGPERNHTLNARTEAELTYFDRRSHTTGLRARLRPTVTYPMRTAGTFVTPRATLHVTRYMLNRTEDEASLDDDPSIAIPEFGLDLGMFLERPVTLGGRPATHTLEPRIHYLLVPYERQDALPNFDTGDSTFSFGQLFRANRFSGGDRVGDANQLTVGLTSRLLDERGGEIVRASVGQTGHFRDRKVMLGEAGTPETAGTSDFVTEVDARLARDWRLRAGLQYDTGDGRIDGNALQVRYQPDRRSIFDAAYRFGRDGERAAGVEQVDLSFVWPFEAGWRAVGRWSFALGEADRTLETLGGLTYESCCFAFRLMARRFLSHDEPTDDDGRYSDGVYLQFEIKGLTGTGYRPGALLVRRIPGYENDF